MKNLFLYVGAAGLLVLAGCGKGKESEPKEFDFGPGPTDGEYEEGEEIKQ